MKIALIQFNPTVGELESNAKRLLDFAGRAHAEGAEVAVASELALPGYPPRDLLERRRFVDEIEAVTTRIAAEAPPDLTLIFGSVERAGGTSSLALNQAVVAHGGQIVSRATKQLLPSYDVFDETRHFEPGRATVVHELGGQRLALTVCEDAWASSPAVGSRYDSDPLGVLGRAGADVLINLSASPFTLDKLRARPELFSDIARRYHVPVVFVNQVGANDELIFDGRSSVWDASGVLLARAEMFAPDLLLVDLKPGSGAARMAEEAGSAEEAAYRALVLGVRDYTRKCGFERVVLGLSGGIDSALTAVLAADALGPENVLGLAMPTRYSSRGSVDDARVLAENLGIDFRVVDIDGLFAKYVEELGPVLDAACAPRDGDVTFENIQARIRGTTLMAVSNRTGAMVLTTGNKSEIAVGYCTLYGDMAGGLAAISDLPKTMVYRLSRWVNRDRERIPAASITKPPSAELRPDQLDQDSLPPYDELDAVLELYVEDHLGPRDIVERGFSPALVNRVVSLVRGSEYKRRQAAPGLIITRKAFGLGRRVPVAQRFSERV